MILGFYEVDKLKTQYATEIAKIHNFQLVEYRLFYLAMAIFAAERKISVEDLCSNIKLLDNFNISVSGTIENPQILINNKDQSVRTKDEVVIKTANEIEKYKIFKEFVISKIRTMGATDNILIYNRYLNLEDIGCDDLRFITLNHFKWCEDKSLENLDLMQKRSLVEKIKKLSEKSNGINMTYIINDDGDSEKEIIKKCSKIIENHPKFSNNRGIRILLSKKCNYNCVFCHKEWIFGEKEEYLKAEDYVFLCRVLKNKFGIKKATFSGGEPLLRNDISEIIKGVKALKYNTSLTTNGYFVNERKEMFKSLDKINISFHANNKELYEKITKTKNTYEKVKQNIKEIRHRYPKLKMSLNVVFSSLLFENYKNIIDLVNFAIETNCILKFIEVDPITSEYFLNIDILQKLFLNLGYYLSEESFRKTRYTKGNNHIVLERCFCSAVREMEDPQKYCNENNDIFLTMDGAITFCRNSGAEISILKEIKDRDEVALINKIEKALKCMASCCIYKK